MLGLTPAGTAAKEGRPGLGKEGDLGRQAVGVGGRAG